MSKDFKKIFEDKFAGIESFGFSALVKFIGTDVGVSIWKDFGDEASSLIKIGVLRPSKNTIEPLYISITHGRKTSDGIIIRDKVKLTNPVDIYSLKNTGEGFFSAHSMYLKDNYSYDKVRNVFLKNNLEIAPKDLVQEVFERHIKTTKLIRGLFVRTRLWFWQVILPGIFYNLFYNLLHYLLLFISGDRYTYNVFRGKGETNEQPLSDESGYEEPKPKEEQSEKMDIFGYKLSQHAAVVYSLLSLALYLYFYIFCEQLRKNVDHMSDNALIVLFYVIVTLHFFDKWLPSILKFCIDVTVKAAYFFATKPVRV